MNTRTIAKFTLRVVSAVSKNPPQLLRGVFKQPRDSATLKPIGIVCSVTNRIKMVCLRSIPSQITNTIVGANSVAVTSLHPIRAWADKRLKNKAVYNFWNLIEIYVVIAVSAYGSFQQSWCPKVAFMGGTRTPNPPQAANFTARKLFDWSPLFRLKFLSVKFGISHASSPQTRMSLVRPVRMFTHSLGSLCIIPQNSGAQS